MKQIYQGPERRQFIRLDYVSPLNYKVCKKETISKLLEGYTTNISQAGLLCSIKDRVSKNDILWLSFDRSTLEICQELEKRSLIYQNGVIGKVVRVERKKNNTYAVGVQFITREEKNLTHIYPKIYFLEKKLQDEKT
ncbi:MAG: PilZ domain-containing protein [Candidatus Omnitrophica bacterium]|nr:PilZ domain-containing protein [Candidatus Omnitrophota bacterium]